MFHAYLCVYTYLCLNFSCSCHVMLLICTFSVLFGMGHPMQGRSALPWRRLTLPLSEFLLLPAGFLCGRLRPNVPFTVYLDVSIGVLFSSHLNGYCDENWCGATDSSRKHSKPPDPLSGSTNFLHPFWNVSRALDVGVLLDRSIGAGLDNPAFNGFHLLKRKVSFRRAVHGNYL